MLILVHDLLANRKITCDAKHKHLPTYVLLWNFSPSTLITFLFLYTKDSGDSFTIVSFLSYTKVKPCITYFQVFEFDKIRIL